MLRSGTKLRLPSVVIVGAGFGGLQAAKKLAGGPLAVTVIDRRNYHLFQPLLYQVATAALSPAEVAAPIRGILRDARNCEVMLAKVIGVDPQAHTVMTDRGEVRYDTLQIDRGAVLDGRTLHGDEPAAGKTASPDLAEDDIELAPPSLPAKARPSQRPAPIAAS
jgi:NADH dehydrogenase FAD-containing subunit